MLRRIGDEQLQGTLTVKEVRSILNKYGVPYNEFALKAMIRQSKQHRVKQFMHKCYKFAAGFIKALWLCLMYKLSRTGKYVKGGTVDGRKDM